MSEPTKSATVLNASEEFLEVTAGMSDEDRVDFWFSFLFSLDHYPDQDYEGYLPIWKRWKARKESQPV